MLVAKITSFIRSANDILHTVDCAICVTSGDGRLTYRREGGEIGL